MKVTTIYLEKSKTIEVSGIGGRDVYRKIVVGHTADIDADNYAEEYLELSDMVDTAIILETKKIKEQLLNRQK